MPLEKIHAVIGKKNSDEGIAYIVTGSKHLIEAQIFNGLIVNVKSRTLSHDQIIEVLLTDDVSQVDVSPANVRLETAQSATIEKTFQASSPFIFSRDEALPQRILSMLRLMAHLAKSGSEGFAAFDVIAHEILTRFPQFSLESGTIRKRVDSFMYELRVSIPTLNSTSVPADRYSIPGWVFDSITISESVIKNIFLYFVFFGEMPQHLFKTITKKESGFGAKTGSARVSKVVYNTASDSNTVIIFKGVIRVGELNLSWHTGKTPEIFITKPDLDKLGLTEGDFVGLIFHKK